MSKVIYTIKNEPPDFVVYILPPNWEKPKEFFRGSVAEDVIESVEYLLQDHEIKRVSNRTFQEAIEDRTYHSDEILQYLASLPEGNHELFYLYGSSHRNIHGSFSSCLFTTLIQVDQQETGYYTYVLTHNKLDCDAVDDYELTFISRPHSYEKEV